MTRRATSTVDYRLFFEEWPISEEESRKGGWSVKGMLSRGDRVTHVVTQGGVIRIEAVPE